jgi:hypothetical protein
MKANSHLTRFLSAAVLALLASASFHGAPAVAGDSPIISTKFDAGADAHTTLDATQTGLLANTPAGKWVWGAGWNWGGPYIPAAWDAAPQSIVNLAEEKTALGISIASAGKYAKPSQLHISADLAVTGNDNGGGGLGFWSVMPARDDSGDSLVHFTGLNLMLDGGIQVYEDGAPVGAPVATLAITPGQFYTLAYDVNIDTGAISKVIFNGKPVDGLTSTAFKNAATAFAGVLSRQGGGVRVSMNNFAVTATSDVPAHPAPAAPAATATPAAPAADAK